MINCYSWTEQNEHEDSAPANVASKSQKSRRGRSQGSSKAQSTSPNVPDGEQSTTHGRVTESSASLDGDGLNGNMPQEAANSAQPNEQTAITETATPPTTILQTSSSSAESATCEKTEDSPKSQIVLPAGLKPYYNHAGIVILHGDCREILPRIDEDSADLVLTDPPYGIDYCSGWTQSSLIGDESQDIAKEGIALALSVLKYSRHLYVFGRIEVSHLALTSPVELIWDKDNIGMGNLEIPWGSQHEYIQFYVSLKRTGKLLPKGGLAARLRRGSVLRYPRINAAALCHPSEKPVALIRELIESSSRIGETILDPFMGSGSTLEAARKEDRQFIGIEIEERYCEIAAKRLSQEVFQF